MSKLIYNKRVNKENNSEKDDEKMLNLKMTNFETLDTKVTNAFRFQQVEETIKNFFDTADEIVLKNNNYFVYKNGEVIGGVVVKEYEKPNVEILNGDIFYADLGEQDGTNVQSGIRPVIIVSNNSCNLHSNVLSVVALTSQERQSLPTHVIFEPDSVNGLTERSTAICEQIIPLCKTRLKSRIGYLKTFEMEKVKKAMQIQLNML